MDANNIAFWISTNAGPAAAASRPYRATAAPKSVPRRRRESLGASAIAASMASARAFHTAGGGAPTNDPDTGKRSTDNGVMPAAANSPGSAGPTAAGGASPRPSASAVKNRRPSSNASIPAGIELYQYRFSLSGSTASTRPPGRV